MGKKITRDRWPSRTLFIFATVGSAVGLGNIWRFPYLVGKYGGGAFLLPYLIALFLIGFPLLIMEFAIGQKMQLGSVGSLKKIDKKFAGIGLGAAFSSFIVSCYYAIIMGWCLLYILYSFNLGWGEDTHTFFFNQVLQATPGPEHIEGFSLQVLLALGISWILVYFCIWKGVKSVSTVVQITMPLPVLLLFILLCRTLVLPGAWDGLLYYVTPNFEALLDLEVWMAAITQIFFTITLGFGVMIAYASYLPKKSDIVMNALITALSDVAIALTAGLVVFTTIGYMSTTDGVSIEELASTGPSLAFVVLPEALSLIPGAWIFSMIFFIMLLTLAIDSLFSLVESVAVVLEDHFPRTSKKIIVFFVCLVGFIGGLIFATTAGIYYLDIVDHFITNYGLVLVDLLIALVIGWYYGAEKMRQYINKVSDFSIGKWWNFMIRYLIPASLITVLSQTFYSNLTTPYGDYPEWVTWSFGWGPIAVLLITCAGYSFFQLRKEN